MLSRHACETAQNVKLAAMKPGVKHVANLSHGLMVTGVNLWSAVKLPVMSTGRNFEFYRQILFEGKPAEELLHSLQGKTIVDIGCGHTPYLSDSMFQTCHRHGIDFYGVDPKLDGKLNNDLYNKFLQRFTGAKGQYDVTGPGTQTHCIAGFAHELPFEDRSVDIILSSFLMFVWLNDAAILTSIMHEFERVLKPGGEMRFFPQPHWDKLADETFGQVVSRYTVRQKFYPLLTHGALPSYLTILQKPA